MPYLMIENIGEIELNALKLMGVSTKRAQDKIGVFGTGTKYALAALLQEGISPIIFSGEKRMTFHTQEAQLRGKSYDQIVLAHEEAGVPQETPLGFTTSMGLNWTVREALRELVSNAMDEDQYKVDMAATVVGRPGHTRVFIPATDDVIAFHWNLSGMFCRLRKPIAEFSHWKGAAAIYECLGPGVRVYRKGVLVFEDQTMTSAFDYDISWLLVHEDRRSGLWEIQYALASLLDLLSVHQKVAVLKLVADPGLDEEKILESQINDSVCSLDWKEAIEHLSPLSEPCVISSSAAEVSSQKWTAVSLPERWAKNLTNGVIGCRGAEKPAASKGSSPSKLASLVGRYLPDEYLAEIGALSVDDYSIFCHELRDEAICMIERDI